MRASFIFSLFILCYTCRAVNCVICGTRGGRGDAEDSIPGTSYERLRSEIFDKVALGRFSLVSPFNKRLLIRDMLVDRGRHIDAEVFQGEVLCDVFVLLPKCLLETANLARLVSSYLFVLE